jgi:hypothetical protein
MKAGPIAFFTPVIKIVEIEKSSSTNDLYKNVSGITILANPLTFNHSPSESASPKKSTYISPMDSKINEIKVGSNLFILLLLNGCFFIS